MASLGSLIVAVPLVVAGSVLALAGRDLHDAIVSAVGFLIGFGGLSLGWFGPRLAENFGTEGIGMLLFQTVFALALAVVAGLLTWALFWWAYRFAIQLPGLIGGGLAAASVLHPVQGLVEVGIVLLAAAVCGGIVYLLYRVFLVVETALVGGLLVATGVVGQRVLTLPLVTDPGRLLTEPVAVVAATAQASQLFVATTAAVTVVGIAVQASQLRPLTVLAFPLHVALLAVDAAVGIGYEGEPLGATDSTLWAGDGYEVVDIEDRSVEYSKRVRATVVVDDTLSKEEILDLIPEVVSTASEWEFRHSERTFRKWAGEPADVVWLMLFDERRDPSEMVGNDLQSHFVGRAEWFSPAADEDILPSGMDGYDAQVEESRVTWSSYDWD